MYGVRAEARERFFEQYNRQQLLLAEQASRTVEELFDTFRRDLGLIVSLFEEGGEPVSGARAEEVRTSLTRVYESLAGTPVIDMALFNPQGTVVWSFPPSPKTVGTNLAWREYFLWARDKGKPGQIYLTPWMEMKAGRALGKRALLVVEGIYGKGRSFKGIAIFTVDFDDLARKYILPVRIGKSGYAWLADARHRTVLVDPTGNVNGRSFDEAFLPRWKRIYSIVTGAGTARPGTDWYDFVDPSDAEKSVRKLVGYAPVRIGDHRWVLGVATPQREVEALFSSFLHRQEVLSVSLGVAILAGATLACGLLIAWNNTLSRRVALRTKDLAEARAELVAAEKLAAVGQLALGLTHEIRNPLSAIRMNVQMIRQESMPEGPLQENFAIVEEEILRLNRLLSDVMGFARPKPLSVVPTDLKDVVRRVARLMERQLDEEKIELDVRSEGDLKILCDPEQVQQVLLNLLLNAVEALKDVPDGRRIAVSAERHDDAAYLRVTDTGVGVRPEDRDRIFDAFFTTKAQGGGLGLATVQSIVLRHGGGISLEGEGARGTTFVVRLPADGPQPADGGA
ncbi:MAG: GHKL domain-containing protein [Deltaproteobacteria bacterium]|nr:GHKL domain-containing protein [Deltaproteobacteria bacterium]